MPQSTPTTPTLSYGPFLKHPDGFEYALYLQPGFDCRGGCTPDCPHANKVTASDRGGNYGRRNDQCALAVRLPSAALQAKITTPFINGVIDHDAGRLYRPGTLCFCATYPMSEEHVRTGPGSAACPALGVPCYVGLTTGIGTDELFAPLLAQPDFLLDCVHERLRMRLLDHVLLWQSLSTRLMAEAATSRADSLKLPAQCQHCKGSGLAV